MSPKARAGLRILIQSPRESLAISLPAPTSPTFPGSGRRRGNGPASDVCPQGTLLTRSHGTVRGFWAWDRMEHELYQSVDLGMTWERADLPYVHDVPVNPWFLGGNARVAAIAQDQTLLFGRESDGLLGASVRAWSRIYGGIDVDPRYSGPTAGRYGSRTIVAIDHSRADVFVTNGNGVFRLGHEHRAHTMPKAIPMLMATKCQTGLMPSRRILPIT